MKDEFDKYFDVNEKRVEARLNVDAEIFIETVSQAPGDPTPPTIVQCDCVDLSANGLQVLVNEALTPGAIHAMIVEVSGQDQSYRLTAEVRWVKPYKSEFLTGLMLYDSEGTEIVDWKFLMSRFLN